MTNYFDVVAQYLRRGEPIRVIDAIKHLGIEYVTMPLPDGSSGRIERDGDKFTIFVNSAESEARQRFTAAHELAHFLLHRDLLIHSHADRLFDAAPNSNPPEPFTRQDEYEANNMAANILMPQSRVEHNWRTLDGNLHAMAEKFGVSPAAMKVRLKVLGLMHR